jgi:hypothetical protein
MKMGGQDDLNIIQPDSLPFQADQGRGPTIDQEIYLFAGDMETGVQSSAAAKGISTSYELQPHKKIPFLKQ